MDRATPWSSGRGIIGGDGRTGVGLDGSQGAIRPNPRISALAAEGLAPKTQPVMPVPPEGRLLSKKSAFGRGGGHPCVFVFPVPQKEKRMDASPSRSMTTEYEKRWMSLDEA
jgi:hypothetical protein